MPSTSSTIHEQPDPLAHYLQIPSIISSFEDLVAATFENKHAVGTNSTSFRVETQPEDLNSRLDLSQLACLCNHPDRSATPSSVPNIPSHPNSTTAFSSHPDYSDYLNCSDPSESKTFSACHCFFEQYKKISHLQSQLKTAAELGHALYLRHKAYVSKTKEIKSRMIHEIAQLEEQLSANRLESSRITSENAYLIQQLKTVSNSLCQSESKINSLNESLKYQHATAAKVKAFKARSDSLETQIELLESIREELQQENSEVVRDKKLVEARWHKTECMLEQLTAQYQHLECEARSLELNMSKNVDPNLESIFLEHNIAQNPKLKKLMSSLISKNNNLESQVNNLDQKLKTSEDQISELRAQLAYAMKMHIGSNQFELYCDNVHCSVQDDTEEQIMHIYSSSGPQFHEPSKLQPQFHHSKHLSKDELSVYSPNYYELSPEDTTISLAEELARVGNSLDSATSVNTRDHTHADFKTRPTSNESILTIPLYRSVSNTSLASLGSNPLPNQFSLPESATSFSESSESLISTFFDANNRCLMTTPSSVTSQIASVSALGTFAKGFQTNPFVNNDSSVNDTNTTENDYTKEATFNALVSTNSNAPSNYFASKDYKPRTHMNLSHAKLTSIASNHNLVSMDITSPVPGSPTKPANTNWLNYFTKWKSADAISTSDQQSDSQTEDDAQSKGKDDTESNSDDKPTDLTSTNTLPFELTLPVSAKSTKLLKSVKPINTRPLSVDFSVSGLSPVSTPCTSGFSPSTANISSAPSVSSNTAPKPPQKGHNRRTSSIIPTLLPGVKPNRLSLSSTPKCAPSFTCPSPLPSPTKRCCATNARQYRLTNYNYNPANGDGRYSVIGIGERNSDVLGKSRYSALKSAETASQPYSAGHSRQLGQFSEFGILGKPNRSRHSSDIQHTRHNSLQTLYSLPNNKKSTAKRTAIRSHQKSSSCNTFNLQLASNCLRNNLNSNRAQTAQSSQSSQESQQRCQQDGLKTEVANSSTGSKDSTLFTSLENTLPLKCQSMTRGYNFPNVEAKAGTSANATNSFFRTFDFFNSKSDERKGQIDKTGNPNESESPNLSENPSTC